VPDRVFEEIVTDDGEMYDRIENVPLFPLAAASEKTIFCPTMATEASEPKRVRPVMVAVEPTTDETDAAVPFSGVKVMVSPCWTPRVM
jgi:hypothetical protein